MDKRTITNIRNDFPILKRYLNDRQIAYLDSAASSQIPNPVLEKMRDFYLTSYANVHRGVDTLGYEATLAYENAREKVRDFINAKRSKEIIFTSGCTESINLVCSTYGENNINTGDEIVISILEHHSNLLPWQQLAKRKNAKLKYLKLTDNYELDLEDAKKQITNQTKIVALTEVSNVLGVKNPVKEIIKKAHQVGAVVLIDGAQAAGHFKVNVQDLDADFYTFSGHKMLGPAGIGVLFGKEELLTEMPPYKFGGEMISNVTKYDATWADLPHKFEAGTPNIVGAIGIGYAIDYLNSIGIDQVNACLQSLTDYLFNKLSALDFVKIYGNKENCHGLVSFNLKSIHPHDVATALDQEGVEVRAGHHCAQPLMTYLGINATVRASLYLYNNQKDIDQLISALKETEEFF